MKIILASASPRRAQILSDARIAFETLPAETDESRHPGEEIADMVRRLARAKARATVARLGQASLDQGTGAEITIVIGADTAVEVDGDAMGKPKTAEAARVMLRRLRGRSHHVHTGICLIRLPEGTERCEVETTEVRLAQLDRQEIDAYIATGESFDKAGGYGVQGTAGRFVERIGGCYFNVVGLPLARVYGILREWGFR